MADFSMPQALELEASRKNALPAVRRQVFHDTTTQNQYRPGETCYIPVETGAAGAFMDTSCTRLEMTIIVRNKNYFTDFINLPRCGWHAIISEFGIEINNGIHEQNRHYAECIELDMIKLGENRTPFEMTKSNPFKLAGGLAGLTHINFVKPSMVTNLGLPHNVIFPPLTTNTTATTPDIISDNLLFRTNIFTHHSFGRTSALSLFSPSTSDIVSPLYVGYQQNLSSSTEENIVGPFASSSFPIPYSAWDDRITGHPQVAASYNVGVETYTVSTGGNKVVAGTTLGQQVNMNSQYRIIGGPVYSQNVGKLSKCVAHDFEIPSSTGFNYLFKNTYGQSVSEVSPAQWPSKQPCDLGELNKEYMANARMVNQQNVTNYYANCKNIPVGIPLDLSDKNSGRTVIWGDKTMQKPYKTEYTSVGAETHFHVSLKVYSSLIGELTKKWFPELVVPSGRMRIRIRFQEPNIVFQTLMDPCRRVPGTSRDFFPNLGVVESAKYAQDSGSTNKVRTAVPINLLETCSPHVLTSGIHQIMIANYEPGQIFNDSVAMGHYVVPQMRMKALHTNAHVLEASKIKGTDYNSTNGAMYTSIHRMDDIYDSAGGAGSLSNVLSTTDAIYRDKEAIIMLNKILYDLKQNQEYGYPWRFAGSSSSADDRPDHSTNAYTKANGQNFSDIPYLNFSIKDLQQLAFPEDFRLHMEKDALPGEKDAEGVAYKTIISNVLNDGSLKINDNPQLDVQWKELNWNPFCLPTPQFVPIKDPWNKNADRTISISDYVSEEYLCFGTHLEKSVAQVRRSHRALYPLLIPDSIESKIDERLTYVVENVRLVTQQIILPQTAADSIISAAISGGISIETQAWKEMESILPKAEMQKHLINMAAAFCTDITFVFRPVDMLQTDLAFGYNSFSFYNPFTSFKFELDTTMTNSDGDAPTKADDYNNLGGKPIYYNEMVLANRIPIDVQLQLQAELLPRTPIDNLNELLKHTRWGDQVFGSADYLDLHPRFQPSYQTQKGMVINTLQDGYFGCFVPISALDDQTITCNPFWNPLEISIRKNIKGKRALKDALPYYKPFDSTFHLSWCLETYMGQNGKMRTGVPIVNNNMFLRFDKAHMCREYDTQLLTIANCDARMVFERGGTFQFFT